MIAGPEGGMGVVTSRNIKEQSDPASPDQGSPLSCATVLLMCQKKTPLVFLSNLKYVAAQCFGSVFEFFKPVKHAQTWFANYKKSIGQLEDIFSRGFLWHLTNVQHLLFNQATISFYNSAAVKSFFLDRAKKKIWIRIWIGYVFDDLLNPLFRY